MSEETRNFTPKAIGKIIQLDYDLITSLDGACMYCLTDAQVQMILAITDYYGWVTRWFSSSGTVDKQTILDLQGGLVEALMNGCCDDNSVLSQWTPDGHYQQSDDGGATWHDAPSADPRNPQPKFPPFLPPDTGDPTCTYADAVVQFIKTKVVELISDSTTVEEAIAVITGAITTILVALAATVIGAIIIALLGAVILLIPIAGGAAFKAAFTSAVWNRLRCNIKDHVGDDGSFTQEQIDGIYSQIGTDESGLTALFLKQMVAMMGTIGLTNAARSGLGAADADCSSCSDLCLSDSWVVAFGTEVSRTDTSFFVQVQEVSGGLYASVTTHDPSICCKVTCHSIVGWNPSYVACGDPIDEDHRVPYTVPVCCCWIGTSRVADTGTDIVEFSFEPC